jgi:hypothetical protein
VITIKDKRVVMRKGFKVVMRKVSRKEDSLLRKKQGS